MAANRSLEDTFGDIVRKASAGTKTSLANLSAQTGIPASRLSQLLADEAQPSEREAQTVAKTLHLDARKLADSGLRRWYPGERPLPPFLSHQINAPHPSNGYFIIVPDKNVGAFVDPAGRPQSIIDGFRRAGVEPQYLLLTHRHLDHSDALGAVRKAFPKAKPVIHEIDGATLGGEARDAIAVTDGATIPFGRDEIRMLYTPGHTDGSVCFLYAGAIFTGDTMFAGSVGKLYGDRFGYSDLLHSVRTKILSLPGDVAVFPGHGPPTSVAQEQAHNPFFS